MARNSARAWNRPWLSFARSWIAPPAVAYVLWMQSSSSLQDVIIWGAFIWALTRGRCALAVWRSCTGYLFAAALLSTVLSIPLGAYPKLAARDVFRFLEIWAGMFALPVLFPTRREVEGAIAWSAAVITAALAYDLVRLAWNLGPELLAKAHTYEPFIMNHPNVAATMAGLAFFACAAQSIGAQGRAGMRLAWAAGALMDAAYLVVSASRGPQIAFALAACLTVFLTPSWRARALWALLLVLCGWTVAANLKHINARFFESSMKTLARRDLVWQHTADLARQRPIVGYGYGKKTFEKIYYESRPPKSPFHYPHCHSYWLKLVFEQGLVGLAVYLVAWGALATRILRSLWRARAREDRLAVGIPALMLLLIHLYGLGDYPDSLGQIAQFWLVPCLLVVTARDGEGEAKAQPCQRVAA